MREVNEKLLVYQSIKDIKANQVKEASEIIWSEYQSNKDMFELIETLMQVKLDICRGFFKEYIKNMPLLELNELCRSYCATSINKVSIEKSVFFCVQFWKYGVDEANIAIFIIKITKAYQTTSAKNKKAIQKALLAETKYKILNIDFSNEKQEDIRSLCASLIKIYENEDMPEAVKSWIENNGIGKHEGKLLNTQQNNKEIYDSQNDDAATNKSAYQNTDAEEIVSDIVKDSASTQTVKSEEDLLVKVDLKGLYTDIDKAQGKINDLNHTLSETLKAVNEKRWTVFGLQEEIKKKDDEISHVMDKLRESILEINRLNMQQQELREVIDQLNVKAKEKDEFIKECEHRIQNLVNADNTDEAQKVAELKSSIKSGFQLAYEDYREFERSEYSQDKFDVLKADFRNIFRTLKRLGIEFE